MRAIAGNWEVLLTAALFVICMYGAVAMVRAGELGWAGMAVCCAVGFFQALTAFSFAKDWSVRVLRKQGVVDGLDS